MTDALGNVTTYTYDANGNPQTSVDALGRVTTTIYDAMGRETGTINALGGRTTITYLANGLELSQTDPLGNLTTYGYDSYNRGLLTLQVVASAARLLGHGLLLRQCRPADDGQGSDGVDDDHGL